MSKIILVFFFLVWVPIVGRAQQKVGLVLSGGAAKGFAHLGVIKALEEHHIPIDYIVGTSMGSVIGACYAAGFSVERTEQIILSDELQQWVKGEIQNEYNYYFNKDDDSPSWIKLDFSIDSSLNATINSTIANDLSINFVLSERFARESQAVNYNYDSLFVPYRAVAAEVFTQRTVVLDSGNLGRSVRASMSVPFFYRPIKINDQYMIDGGIYNNFPTDIMQQEFAPDIIIGVNVATSLYDKYPKEKDDKLITNSLLYMMLNKSDPSGVGKNGIYIAPNLKKYTGFDFDKVEALIDSGYQATIRQIPEIKRKILSRVSPQEVQTKREQFKQKVNEEMVFGDLNFHGFNSKQKNFIRKMFGKKKNENKLSFEDVKTGYYRLVSEDYFATIFPDIKFDPTTQSYNFHIYGRPHNNFTTSLGGVVSTRSINHVFVGLKYARFDKFFSKTNLDFFVGNFYKSASLKSKFVLPSHSRIYIGLDARYNNWNYINISELVLKDVNRSIVNIVDRYVGIEAGIPIGGQYKFCFRSAALNNRNRYSNINQLNTSDTLDDQTIRGWKQQIELSTNTLNRPQYATGGKRISLTATYFDIKEKYKPGNTSKVTITSQENHKWIRFKLNLEQYFQPSKKFAYGYILESVISNQEEFANTFGSTINTPAFYPLSDSHTLIFKRLRSYNYVAIGMRSVFSLTSKIDFRLEGYAFKSLNRLIQKDDLDAKEVKFTLKDTFITSNAGLVYHSPIGPMAVNLNFYDDTRNRFGVFVHLGYVIFKKSSLE